MSHFAAIVTSDASLARCAAEALWPRLDLGRPEEAFGVGAWQDDQVLLRRYGPGLPKPGPAEVPDSAMLIVAGHGLAPGQPLEEAGQPWRFRRWLFAAVGRLERPEAVRERLLGEVPEFLHGQVRSQAWGEAVFARFLTELRRLGRIEDPTLDAATVAGCLAETARAVNAIAAAVGGPTRPAVGLLASNGRVLVGSRLGAQPLAWALSEGLAACARHEVGPTSREAEPLVRDHRRLRSVVVATTPLRPEGWTSLADGATVAVDHRLAISVA